jgi:adenine-specific DNA-methyltransferase
MPTLHWLTKDADVGAASKVPYRLLEEVPELGAGDRSLGNMILQGDNLEALKSLLPFYAGQVKCIYIDPPYNTGSAFEHYDDNLEHSQWLAMIYPRLELLRDLLDENGSIWVSMDDDEAHYLKVVMDEVFGRSRFVATCIWQKRYSRDGRGAIGDAHESIFCFSKNPERFKEERNLLPLSDKQKKLYKNPDNDPRGAWQSVSMLAQGFRPNQMYEIVGPDGRIHRPPDGNCWKLIQPVYEREVADSRIAFGPDGKGVPRRKYFLSEAEGMVPWTWWPHEEVGHTGESKAEIKALFGDDIFATPKPERLIERILQIATKPNDLVLDSFLGSGTTAAVAQKMGRRYIGIEMGDHAVTHCQPRLAKVIAGEQGGISASVNWNGGGGFRFYRLGAAVFDPSGHISKDISFPVLAAHIWFSETGAPWNATRDTPFLGAHDGKAYALLYNGILGDKSVSGGNVLTRQTLALIREKSGPAPLTIYGERSALGAASLKRENITFKQTPYDVKARA